MQTLVASALPNNIADTFLHLTLSSYHKKAYTQKHCYSQDKNFNKLVPLLRAHVKTFSSIFQASVLVVR